ncbi:MAG: hypothetical protein JSS76_06920 [Bacteroidetes bacterium]|nr:hypothetical protein [Bacteroidota bacterium]
MMELLSIEKLKEYGFTDLMIERLADAQNEYDCKVANDKGFFYASNKSGFIYSGEMGYDKFYGIGIDRFKTFESMFEKAVAMQSVDLQIDPKLPEGNKAAIYHANRNLYNFEFNSWIQRFKGWEYGDAEKYISLLTKEVWLEFMAYKAHKEEAENRRYEADKASWKLNSAELRMQEIMKPMARLGKVFGSDSYKIWEQDSRECLERWQYLEPADMELADRYSLDKEAYIKTFFDSPHDHDAKYSEKALLKRLINNLQTAKHPRFIEYREYLESLQSKLEEDQGESIASVSENDLSRSTIEDWLYPFKQEGVIREAEYNRLVMALEHYFKRGTFPNLTSKIRVGRVNKKRFGWALSQIYKSERADTLSADYLQFAKDWITIFSDATFDKANMKKGNLYKYFTTKTE